MNEDLNLKLLFDRLYHVKLLLLKALGTENIRSSNQIYKRSNDYIDNEDYIKVSIWCGHRAEPRGENKMWSLRDAPNISSLVSDIFC